MLGGTAERRTSCPRCRAVFRGGFVRCPRDGEALASLVSDPLIGTVLAGTYRIEAMIGEGGLGRVYRARHVRMSRTYAIKVPFGEVTSDAKARARFANEAEAVSRVSHPNVIGVVDVGETADGLLYIAMDLAEGPSLASEIDRVGAMPAARVRGIVRQLASGLAHAHERGLVHRDLKPDNIILETDADGRDVVRIVDFGLALVPDAGRMTTAGIIVGTPMYMAPEQATDSGLDHRVDIFALGLITYELLAGVLPFEGTPIEIVHRNLTQPIPPIAERVPGLVVEPRMEALAMGMVRKAAGARTPLREVIAALDAMEAPAPEMVTDLVPAEALDDAVVVPSPEPEPTIARRPRRQRARLGLVAIGAVVLAVLAWLAAPGETHQAHAREVPVEPPPSPSVSPSPAPAPSPAPSVSPAQAPASKPARVPKPSPKPKPRVAAKPTAPTAPPTRATLTSLYQKVGAAIDRLHDERGASAARPYKARYAEVAYLEAVRAPDVRAAAVATLRALDRDVATALR